MCAGIHVDTRVLIGTRKTHRGTGLLDPADDQIEGDGAVSVVRDQVGISNGLAFDPLRGRAYFADTPNAFVVLAGEFVNSRSSLMGEIRASADRREAEPLVESLLERIGDARAVSEIIRGDETLDEDFELQISSTTTFPEASGKTQ